MLFDDMLRSIKPRATTFKIADRGGMYVPPCGVRPFRAYRAPTERPLGAAECPLNRAA